MKNVPGYWNSVEEAKKKLSRRFHGHGNPNFGIPMSNKQKQKIRKNAERRYGKNNPTYGKSVYTWWVEKYGKETADQKLNKSNHLKSIAASGENNSMYGKPSPHGAGNGWSGWYKGWFFRSLHELSYMINVIEKQSLSWESAEKKKYAISYVDWKGNQRTHYADFIVSGTKMVECKPTRLHNTPSVLFKQNGAVAACQKTGLTYCIECPILLTDAEIEHLHDTKTITFLSKYEDKFNNRRHLMRSTGIRQIHLGRKVCP